MYVLSLLGGPSYPSKTNHATTGRISKSNTPSAKKSPTHLPRALPPMLSTTTSSSLNWPIYNRKSSTIRCLRPALYLCLIKSTGCRMLQLGRVSCPVNTSYPQIVLTVPQSKARRQYKKKMTKRKSYGDCKPRWPCEMLTPSRPTFSPLSSLHTLGYRLHSYTARHTLICAALAYETTTESLPWPSCFYVFLSATRRI